MKKILGLFVLTYLKFFAKLELLKNPKAVIVGITGSAGKTSTRKAVTLILKTKGRVKESVRANSESGIPLSILGIKMTNYSLLSWAKVLVLAPLKLFTSWERFDYFVVEMGIDSPNSPKNMSYLLSIIRPDVGVVLNAGLVHSEYFDHLVIDQDPVRRAHKVMGVIAQEKMKLASGVKPTGFAVVNLDQKELVDLTKGISARLLSIGSSAKARFHFDKPRISRAGFTLSFRYQNQLYSLTLPDFYEGSYAYTFAAALAVGAGLGIPLPTGIKALSAYTSPSGRMRVFEGIRNYTLIDSSYNASPTTMESALKLLKQVAGTSHTVAIVGDMRELGRESKYAHKLLADWIQKYAKEALLIGTETGTYTQPVLEAKKFKSSHFSTVSSLIEYAKELPPGSIVLVKGSQNTIFLERVVEALLASPADVNKLCRRGSYWDKIRAKLR